MQTCSKQYKNAAEMEAHLSSYDHHHKKVGLTIEVACLTTLVCCHVSLTILHRCYYFVLCAVFVA